MVAPPIEFEAADRDPQPDPDQEQELLRLRAELEEYQHLIEDLPEIYAAKFRQRVEQVAREIRGLMQEREGLQDQIQRALAGSVAAPALQPAAGSAEEQPPAAQAPAATRLRRRAPLVAVGVATACGVALIGAVGLQRLRSSPEPRLAGTAAIGPVRRSPARPSARPPVRPAVPELRLRARGDCWIEVRTLDGSLVKSVILQQGQTITMPLRGGLRLRAGRPDLLDVATGDRPFRPFGSISDLDWQTLAPPASGVDPS